MPVTFTPFFIRFSDCFRYHNDDFFDNFRILNKITIDKNIINKKIFYDEELIYNLDFEDGLCYRFFDCTEVKGAKSIYFFDYDKYKRLKLFKEQYTYKDEIRDLRTYEYKYVYDFFSRTMFIFIFNKDEIKTVYYLKKQQDGYCISSFTDLMKKNKEPSEYIGYCSANLIFENGLIKEVYETSYDRTGNLDKEHVVKITYENNLKISEELSVKRQKDRNFRKVFNITYQYDENSKIQKKIQINYDERERGNNEVSKSVTSNFIYDSNGNKIYCVCSFENLMDKHHNYEECEKTVITYK